MKKYLLIGASVAFLASCGQNGDLVKGDSKIYKKTMVKEEVKKTTEVKTMKLSQDSGLDSKTTKVYKAKTVKKTQPMYDTGMRPTNSK